MKTSPAVPLGAAGAKNLEFLPKNQFFTIKNYIFSDFGGGLQPSKPSASYGPEPLVLSIDLYFFFGRNFLFPL